MNQMYRFLALASLLGIAACSSMKVDDPMDEALPADFELSVYSEINPDIAAYQLRDSVARYNKIWKDSLTGDQITADTTEFLHADTAFSREVFTRFAGYPYPDDQPWKDSLDYSQSRIMLFFNRLGKSWQEDKTFLETYPIDSSLIAIQYSVYGIIEGRPYKYCVAGGYDSVQTESMGTLNARGVVDYRPSTFCLNQDDTKIYRNIP